MKQPQQEIVLAKVQKATNNSKEQGGSSTSSYEHGHMVLQIITALSHLSYFIFTKHTLVCSFGQCFTLGNSTSLYYTRRIQSDVQEVWLKSWYASLFGFSTVHSVLFLLHYFSLIINQPCKSEIVLRSAEQNYVPSISSNNSLSAYFLFSQIYVYQSFLLSNVSVRAPSD